MAKSVRSTKAPAALPTISEPETQVNNETETLELDQTPANAGQQQRPINPIVEAALKEMTENSVSPSQMLAKAGISSSLNTPTVVDEPEQTTDQQPVPVKKKYKLHVVLRKIPRKTFRLGMEKTEENYQLVPGTAQTFVPFKRGDNFLTGLEDKPKIKARLESELGIDLSPSSKFYETLTYRMEDRKQGQLLVIEEGYSGSIMELIYYCMLAAPIIANGMPEYTSGLKPEAEWYIENKEAEAEANEKTISDEMEAFTMFTEMSPTRRSQIAKILDLKVQGLSEKVIKTMLWNHIKKPASQNQGVNNIVKFLQEARRPDTTIAVKALVRDAIFHNVLRVNAARDFMYGEDNLGSTMDSVEEKLLSPRNIQLRTSIDEKVNLKLV